MGHGTPVSDQVSDNGTEHSGISVPGPGRLATGKIIEATPVRGASGQRGHDRHGWAAQAYLRVVRVGPTVASYDPAEPSSDMSERQAHAEATYERLFGPRERSAPDNDPELMEILRRFIFGDVFDTGVLDDRSRELITVTVLACLQALPQLKAHTAAALNGGAQPFQVREAVYQLAPFIGFPRTLNAVATINEVFQDQGIELPLRPKAPCRTATGTPRVSRSRHRCTATRSRTTWPTCPNRSTGCRDS